MVKNFPDTVVRNGVFVRSHCITEGCVQWAAEDSCHCFDCDHVRYSAVWFRNNTFSSKDSNYSSGA